MNHHLSTLLRNPDGTPLGNDTRARFTRATPRGAVLFVHGFRGNALGTWLDFPFSLPREEKVAEFDLFYYGYDTRKQAGVSAGELRPLLGTLAEDPGRLVRPSWPSSVPGRAGGFQYDQVVIAAHSLGALVTRLALLQCLDTAGKPLPWLARVKLVLFAPAHSGALAAHLASKFLFGFKAGGALEALARRLFLSINDLDPGSKTLEGLNERTKAVLAAGPQPLAQCHRARVVHASGEWVVAVDQFLEDHPYDVLSGVDHFEVCKPKRGYSAPLEFLLEAIL